MYLHAHVIQRPWPSVAAVPGERMSLQSAAETSDLYVPTVCLMNDKKTFLKFFSVHAPHLAHYCISW